jgi:small subunit ribosomal protein S6
LAVSEYELVLMLDPEVPDERRDEIATNARGRIESGGTLKTEKAWGLRKMAYEIEQRTEADYRWLRFEASPELLEQLDHNLKIADGVLRFRVFKVDADTPVVVPPATSAPGPGASRERPAEAPAAPATEVAPEAAEAPAAAPAAVAEPAAEPEAVAAAPEPAAETAEPAAEPEVPEAAAEGEPGDSPA